MNETKKKLQFELLMEKLRHKTTHLNLADTAKAFRMTLLERRYGNDPTEKAQYQKCLDLLQTNMKVTSLSSMLERLETISRQLGLQFTSDGASGTYFISSDVFYLEVVIEQGGLVHEVHIHHEYKNERQTCNEIAECLNSGNFSSFTAHLQGLCTIYQVNADKKIKAKVFAALSALEADLSAMSPLQNYIHDLPSLIHKSPLGILQKRIGGQPMSLTYFISPYDLLNVQTQSISQTIEHILEKKLGLFCIVGIENAGNSKLPINQLSVTKYSEGESVPTFASLNAANSTTLPATFVLSMKQPVILCREIANRIQSITGVEVGCWDEPHSLFHALMKTSTSGQMDINVDANLHSKALFVTLPDQHHCYYITDTDDDTMKCTFVSSIQFSHPSHVPQILFQLRQQALLNTLLSSCIRPKSHPDMMAALTFEVSAITLNHLSISFEHPLLEHLCCLDIDLKSDPTSVQCHLYSLEAETMATDEYATKVLKRCLSIPVTMRAILRQMHSSSRWSASLGSHSGSFERRLTARANVDLDSHPPSNGQYGASNPYNGGGGNFDGSHSPRNHKVDGGQTQNGTGDAPSAEMEESQQEFDLNTPKSVRSLTDDALPRTNTKSSYVRMKSEPWVSGSLSNTDVNLYSMNSLDSSVSLSFATTASLGHNRRPSDISLKSETSEFDVSVLEPSAESSPSGQDDMDSRSPSENVALAVSKNKEAAAKVSVYPSVSITPVSSLHSASHTSTYPNITLERRPGIEIIPLGKDNPVAGGIPSSLTITPVAAKSSKDKDKYKEFRVKESRIYDVEEKDREKESRERERDRDRDRDKERERKERKRRREEEKLLIGGGKPAKMMCLSSTLMGPPSILKSESNSKMTFKTNPAVPLTPSLSPLTPPAKSSSKVPTPSSSPKHPSSGGKPSMSALKSATTSLSGSTSPSSKSKKSKDRDRDRDRERDRERERDRDRDRERDRDRDRDREKGEKDRERERDKERDRERDRDREKEKDRDRDRDRERFKDREKKSRTPTPTSTPSSYSAISNTRGPPLVKTKSLELPLASGDKTPEIELDDPEIMALTIPTNSVAESWKNTVDVTSFQKAKETLSCASPTGQDPENKANYGNSGSSAAENSTSNPSSGSAKSPVRSRKSSLSAVIDKLRLQHNSEGDISPTGSKYNTNPGLSNKGEKGDTCKSMSDFKPSFPKRLEVQGRNNYLDELTEGSDSHSPRTSDEDRTNMERTNSPVSSPMDPFIQDSDGAVDHIEGEDRESTGTESEFVRPFPPSRSAFGMRPYRTGETDINPHSPSVSVHIVNVPSPLALQQTRSPLANQLAIITASGTSPQSTVSQNSPCMIDDDLMDEALVGLGK